MLSSYSDEVWCGIYTIQFYYIHSKFNKSKTTQLRKTPVIICDVWTDIGI